MIRVRVMVMVIACKGGLEQPGFSPWKAPPIANKLDRSALGCPSSSTVNISMTE